jgi:hypothetical protein
VSPAFKFAQKRSGDFKISGFEIGFQYRRIGGFLAIGYAAAGPAHIN